MFGRDFARRGSRIEECLTVLQQEWTGQPFDLNGRPVRVTPTPLSAGGPRLLMGGNSAAVAKRAARLGLGMLAQGTNPKLSEIYDQECRKLGTAPGVCINPPSGSVTSAFISKDPDRAWAALGPYLLHDAQAYAAWMGEQDR